MQTYSYVYQAYNVAGRTIYVGISSEPENRLWQHQTGEYWWPTVAGVVVSDLMSRPEALVREQQLIKTLRPMHNSNGNPDVHGPHTLKYRPGQSADPMLAEYLRRFDPFRSLNHA